MADRIIPKIIVAVPKGRILAEAVPLLAAAGIVPEPAFSDEKSRALRFSTNNPGIDLIRVRAFDVATFVAHGAAQLGIVGSDVLAEFDYSELYAPVDLGIGHCRLSVAEPADLAASDDPRGWSHVRIATKYPHVTEAHFARRGVSAECVKLNGAMGVSPAAGSRPAHRRSGVVGSDTPGKRADRGRADHGRDEPPDRQSRRVQDAGASGAAGRGIPARGRAGAGGVIRLTTTAPGFAADFATLVNARREADADVARDVSAIIARVREDGDAAPADYTRRFDRHDLDATGWQIAPDEWRAAYEALDPTLRDALNLAAERIAAYHAKQKPEGSDTTDAHCIRTGARWNAIQHAGIYIPGGRAAYPSSVLMNAIPAKVAGVDRVVMVTPTPDGEINPLVLAAAHIAGVDELWRIGGAQAIAALAYGTARIAPVDVVTGPGNAWVAEAKRQLYGVVGIDMVAGPSEIVVVADGKNRADWIAADLLSQSEHDPTSQSILFTNDATFADAVAARGGPPDRHARDSQGRARGVGREWRDHRVRHAGGSDPAGRPPRARASRTGCDDPQALFDQVRHAGSVFLGRHTPEAIGDYVAGPNHVLPTGRRARFASGLSVLDFMKRTSFLQLGVDGLAAIGPAAVALAEAEGLPAHARSVALRL